MISSILRRTCCFDLQITRSGDHFAFTSGPSSGVEGVVGIFEHRNANVFALLKTEDRVVHIELSQFFQTARIKEAHATDSELADVLTSVVDAVWPVTGGADPTKINDPKTPPSKLASPQPAVTEPLKSLSEKQLQTLERKRKATEKKKADAAAVIIYEPRERKPTSAPPAPVSAPTVKAKAAGVGATTRRGKQPNSKHKTSTCLNINDAKTITINRR